MSEAPLSTENRIWEVQKVQQHPDDFPFLQIQENGREVAHIYHHPDEYPEAERNARLIAAAPELLAAIKRLLVASYPGTERHHETGCRCVIHEAQVAIAKAEGRNHV